MTFLSPAHKPAQANTLMVTLCITAIIGIALATYLTLTSNQNQLITRSQVWNLCMPVVEAGVEEALTHCSRDYGAQMPSSGWVLNGSEYVKTNSIGDGYYIVTISQATPYTVVSSGYYPMPGGSTYVSRVVKVTTQDRGVFSAAMIVKNSIDLNGNNVLTDSYDSTDPTKSTGGLYDPLKAGDKGDVACIDGVVNSFSVGNANIWGHALTGPLATVTTGPSGAVGDVAWQRGGNSGVEPGWWKSDFNVSFPDVSLPSASWLAPGGGIVNGTNYNYVLDNGTYQLSTLAQKVIVTGNAVLYVTDSIKFASGDLLQIAPGASLKLYMAGAGAAFTTIVNQNARPSSFLYYGLPTNASFDIKGNAALTMGIFAPEADVNLVGGVQLFGSVVAKSARMTGSSAIHYDESLKFELPLRGFIIVSWNEI